VTLSASPNPRTLFSYSHKAISMKFLLVNKKSSS
jgi:hypothetical protein